jgi:hypothetical protein
MAFSYPYCLDALSLAEVVAQDWALQQQQQQGKAQPAAI